jgi:hypothetical protein
MRCAECACLVHAAILIVVHCLAPQAAARQEQFETSGVGKAAYKSVKAAKEPTTRPNNNANDWLT